jgi:hypothetical protein
MVPAVGSDAVVHATLNVDLDLKLTFSQHHKVFFSQHFQLDHCLFVLLFLTELLLSELS